MASWQRTRGYENDWGSWRGNNERGSSRSTNYGHGTPEYRTKPPRTAQHLRDEGSGRAVTQMIGRGKNERERERYNDEDSLVTVNAGTGGEAKAATMEQTKMASGDAMRRRMRGESL